MGPIALINHSTVVDDAEVAVLAGALKRQINHLQTAGWPVNTSVAMLARGTKVPKNAVPVNVVNDTDQADALGYHEITTSGQPIGYVFARTAIEYGISWTVDASHEVCEIVVDPFCDLAVDLGNGDWLAYEVCDPCEADVYGYRIGSVLVSDFVTPAWFSDRAAGPYDWTRSLDSALTLLPGGYAAVQRHGQWTQEYAALRSPDPVSRSVMARRINKRRARGLRLETGR